MIQPPRSIPDRECRALGRYLLGRPPTEYVVRKYAELSAAAPFRSTPADGVDRALVAIAAWHPAAARAADLHARLFRPAGLLRRKLVLLTAILECAPESAPRLQASGGGPIAAIATLGAAGLASTVLLILGLILLLPVRLWFALARPERGQ